MASWKRVLVAGGDAGTPSALVGTNISGTASNLTAGAVTNGVYTTGTQTINGAKTFGSTISGSIDGNAATATTATAATTVTVTDNENTAESNLIPFVADAATSTGNHGLEMDGDFSYHPGVGRLTATQLAGTLMTPIQTNITQVGALAAGSLATGFTKFGANEFISDNSLYEAQLKVADGGSNGYVLTKDSGETGGFKWAAAASAANDGTLTMATSGAINGSATFTANDSDDVTFTVSIDNATTSQKGATQLSDSTSTTSSVLAATCTAVKAAYDLADSKTSCTEANVSSILAALDSSDTLYIGDAGNDATINIRGNLTVAGTTTSINTTHLEINDNKIILNKDASSGEDAAIVVEQGSTGDDIEFMWDQSAGNFSLDSQGVNSTSTSASYMVSCITGGDTSAPDATTDGHGNGSIYVTSAGVIYIYS
tara:strand:- start:612 stop:1895 length:1284 start_codon:yes stop_codon:yes gene_type:complete